ncbi:hypothetical protein [Zunongwangia sp. HGR-M22]|uniref:hypothetical protein n=1 Tax=Zunongwangia sp. HGR-M22 TaxID=3015168 RepID=UPI0022DDD9E7|nr:hypothetical protein [Zunongwangia sp. HGR-M22]WBL26125.1 hypothetical protein PBT91_02260 [Zunongwangia sp. HGR-M22]
MNYSIDDQNGLAFYFYPSCLGGRREVVPSSNLLDTFVDGDSRINLIANADDISSTYIAKYNDVSTETD